MHGFSAFLNTGNQAQKLIDFIENMDSKLDPQFKDQGSYYKVTCDSLNDLQKQKLINHFASYRDCALNWD